MTAQELLVKLEGTSTDASMADVAELLVECDFEPIHYDDPWNVILYYHQRWNERLTFAVESTSVPRSQLNGILSFLSSKLSQESEL